MPFKMVQVVYVMLLQMIQKENFILLSDMKSKQSGQLALCVVSSPLLEGLELRLPYFSA